jgi:hypothetical protein
MVPRLPAQLTSLALQNASKLILRPLGSRRRLQARPLLQGQLTSIVPRKISLSKGPQSLFPTLTAENVCEDAQLLLHLKKFHLDLNPPLVFAGARDDTSAAQVGHTFLPDEHLWLLSDQKLPKVDGVQHLRDPVAGLYLCSVDTKQPPAQDMLIKAGLVRITRPGVRLISHPTLAGSNVRPAQQSQDDPLILRVEGSPVDVLCGEQQRRLQPGLWRLPRLAEVAQWKLNLRPVGGANSTLKIDISEQPERDELVHVHPVAEECSVEALRRKQISARLESDLPLEGLKLSVGLWRRGERIAQVWSDALPPLPCTIPPSHTIWEHLLLAAEAADWSEREALTLRLDAGGLGEAELWLEPLETAFWWLDGAIEFDPQDREGKGEGEGEGKGEGEGEGEGEPKPEVKILMLASMSPLRDIGAQGDAILKQPARVDGGEPVPLLGLGRCVFDGDITLMPLPQQPRLLRRLRAGSSSGAVSLWDLVKGYLSWATALGSERFSEARRRAITEELTLWLASALCGSRWAQLERCLELQPLGEIVLEKLRDADLGGDDFVLSAITDARGERGKQMLDAALSTALTSSHLLLKEIAPAPLQDPSEEHTAALEDLDVLLNAKHNEVLARCLSQDTADEADIYSDQELTPLVIRGALERWRQLSRLHDLLPLLRPSELMRALEDRYYDDEPLEVLAAALTKLLKPPRGAAQDWKWDTQRVLMLLQLWLHPGALNPSNPDLLASLRLALSDQMASRVIRYAALRRQLTMRGK